MVSVKVEVKQDNVSKVEAAIRDLASKRVLVGIPSDKAAREDGEPINNAQLGYIHEFGAPEANIPARPFLVPGVSSVESQTVGRLRAAGVAALEGRPDIADKQLNAAGLTAASAAQAEITQGIPPPLKPATLAARRRRGRTGTTPLLDRGFLQRAITYVIRKLGK